MKCLGCTLESTISKKHVGEPEPEPESRQTFFFPQARRKYICILEENKKCRLCVSNIDCSTNFRREVCKASLGVHFEKYVMKSVSAVCLELVLHSFQMVFLSCNYVKSHIDRNPLAHVIESHSSLAIPEICVGFKVYGSTERSNPRKA